MTFINLSNLNIKCFSLIWCLFLAANLAAQEGIRTENTLGVEDLIRDVFIKGNCRNVSNITTIGNEELSIGQFSGGESVFSFEDGIIISTGAIDLAHGPNFNIDASLSLNQFSEDPDLSQLATDSLFDVTGIEFDFIPIDSRVTFRYVFASEEYCEFVTTAFNDVFGFFVSGPGINGPFENNAINLATLPDNNESVSINTVNHLENTNFYINNVTSTDAANCDIDFNDTFQDFIEYDGFTISLAASFRVIPCETYHIRLMVGDVGDDRLDSAVFLASKSFDLGEKVNIRAVVPGKDEPIAYEDCVDGQFVFTRSSLFGLDDDCPVNFTINPESSATNGVDFLEIPDSITIPSGDTSFILPITILNDNIIEGAENLKLQFEYECDCLDPSLSELIINDPPSEVEADFTEILVCANEPFGLTPEIEGGISPYDFLWETGETTDTLKSSITAPTSYSVTVTDFCGNRSSAIANIGLQSTPIASLMGTFDLCETIEVGIPVQLEGNPPWEIQYSIDGMEQTPIENIQTSPFFLNTEIEGTYSLIAFKDAFCDGRVTGNASVEYSNFNVLTEVIDPTCIHNADGSIEITQLDAIDPFSVNWNIETDNDRFLENLEAGTYTLSIIDGEGCLYENTFDLKAISNDIKDCIPIFVPNSFSPNNDGINDIFSIFYNPSIGVESILSFQVYNRWGVLMYEKNDFESPFGITGWNGDHKGKPLDTGIYVYKILVRFEDWSTQLLSGDVTLFR